MQASVTVPAAVAALGLANLTAHDGMVVLTSILLVFAMLIALSLIVTAEGKLFDALTARKRQKAVPPLNAATPTAAPAAPSAPAPRPAPAPAPIPAAPAAPAADGSVAPEIVAAIAAAVYALEGEGAVVRGIRRLPNAVQRSRRGVWGDAGVAHNVRPF